MRLDTKTIVVLGGWAAYVLFLFFYAEEISGMIASASVLFALLLYLLGNPIYLLTIYGVWQYGKSKGRKEWKRVVASILIILGMDAATFPRLSLTDSLIDGISRTTNIGAIGMRFLEGLGLSHQVAFVTFYIIIPLIFVAMAVELLGITNFVKEVRKR